MSDGPKQKAETESTSDYGRRAKEHTIAGGAVGAAGVGSLAILGVTCPLCVVAAPALLCSGAWNAYKERSRDDLSQNDSDPRDGTVGTGKC